jgi:WD40 repeat protein
VSETLSFLLPPLSLPLSLLLPLQVTFSPDGRWVLSASFDKSIKLWDGVKGTFVATFRNHVGPVFQVRAQK